MRVFKTKLFHRWAVDEKLTDEALWKAEIEMKQGLVDAQLGGHVFKKRVPIREQGKRGGLRTLIAFKMNDNAFFMFGFAKNEQDNINKKELKALKALANQLLSYRAQNISQALKVKELIEVNVP